jgi:methyl-accepting chemotaxis protein
VHPIQRKYFFLSLVPLIACAFLLLVGFFMPLRSAFVASDAESSYYLWGAYMLAIRIWPAVIISMVASGLLSFLITNRFAGPVYRLEQIMRGVAAGQLPRLPIRVRPGDDLQEFARYLDTAFTLISTALTGIREQEQLAAQKLAALEGQMQSGLLDTQEITQGLEVIGRHHKEVEKTLVQFTPSKTQEG